MATAAAAPSLVHGPVADALWTTTLSALIETQARLYPDRIAVSFPWQNVRRTYHELLLRSKLVAKALVDAQLRQGEAVGVIAGNCYEYIEVFLGASWLGCPVVVLNSTYTPQELSNAVTFSRTQPRLMARVRSADAPQDARRSSSPKTADQGRTCLRMRSCWCPNRGHSDTWFCSTAPAGRAPASMCCPTPNSWRAASGAV